MIIGVAGSFGAGKGAVVEYMIREKGFKHYSASGLIKEEIERRGLPMNRDTMIVVANELRKEYGPTHLVEKMYRSATQEGGDAVLESLRAVAEVQKIKELGGTVIGIDAESRIRYERAFKRGTEKDSVSYEKFLAQEKAESNPDDPAKQDVFSALKESDFILSNNGTLEELHTQIDEALKKITK